jgi:hypothetical protein
MADKQAVYTVRVDTGNTINDINSFDKALNNLNKDIDKTQNNLSDSKANDDFAQQLDALNKKVEAGGLSMRQLGKVVREYQSIAIAAGDSSPIGQDAIRAAAELTDRMGDIRSQTTALSSDFVGLDTAVMGIQTGAAVFEGVQSAIALTGVENENLMKTMVKLQAVQGVANSINTIAVALNKESVLGLQLRTAWERLYTIAVGQSTGAMKLLRIAMLSTGIGALVVGVGLLIANFEKVVSVIGKFSGVTKVLQFFGVVDDDVTAKNKKNSQARSNYTKKETDLRVNELNREQSKIAARYDHEINMAKAAGKDTTALEQKKRTEMLKTGRAILAELKVKQEAYRAELAMLIKLGDADSKRAKDLKKFISDGNKDIKEQYKTNTDNANAIEVANAEAVKKANDRAVERKKKRDEELAQIKGFLADAQTLTMTSEEKEFKSIQDKYAAEIALATKHYGAKSQQVQDLEIARMNAENDLNLKYQNEAYAKQKEADDKKLKETEETEKERLALVAQYEKLIMDEYQLELRNFEDAQAEERKALDKALKDKILTEQEHKKGIEVLEAQHAKKVEEINKKKNDAIKEQDKKTLEQKLASVQNMIDIAQRVLDSLNAINDLVKVAEENRLNEIKQTTAQKNEVLNQQQQTELAQQNLTEQQKQSINDKFAKLKYQNDLKAFQEEDKIKRAQFKRDKALRIAQIAIDTASAIAKAIATYGPPPSPMGIFGIASASAIGIAQAAAVASQQYQGGTMPQAPNVSSGVGAGASSFSIGTNTQQTNMQQTNTQTSTPSVTSVVVLEVNDFNEVANKVAVQEAKSIFG